MRPRRSHHSRLIDGFREISVRTELSTRVLPALALACPPVHTGFCRSYRSHFGLTPTQRYSPMKPRCRLRTPSAEQDPTSRPQSNGHSRQRLCNRCLVAATHLTTITTPTLTRASAPPIDASEVKRVTSSSLRYITACQPRRLQWVMLMNPSFSNAPISNLLEATRSTELRLARNHAVLSFCVGAPPMASLKTLSVMRHRHLCPCLSAMLKAIPSNSISNPSFKRDKGISGSSGSVVIIAMSSPSWLAPRHASAGRA
jgi:hypothetical protein